MLLVIFVRAASVTMYLRVFCVYRKTYLVQTENKGQSAETHDSLYSVQ